jgi:hypothetical protein
MTIENNQRPIGSGANFWIGIVVITLVLIALFFVATGIFKLLYYVFPILLVATLILDHKVVVKYLKMLFGLFKKNPIMAIAGVLITIFAYPAVTAVLFGIAFMNWRIKRSAKKADIQKPGEYIEYEEVEDKPLELEDLFENEPIKKEDRTL